MNTIFFDLDGTLLPVQEETFIKIYFSKLTSFFSKRGFDPQQLMQAIFAGISAMRTNDGNNMNDIVFWQAFTNVTHRSKEELEEDFELFYQTEYDAVQESTILHPVSNKIVKLLKDKGYRMALTTNPLFPEVATRKRVAWAGLDADDFEIITTFENCSYAKPNVSYYKDVLSQMQIAASDVLMIGNDVREDMVVTSIGMEVYLVTDCLLNKDEQDIQNFKNGTLEDLYNFCLDLPSIA